MMLQPGIVAPYAATLANITRSGIATSPANASASARLNTNGDAESAPTSGTFSVEFTWKAPWAAAGDYECRMTTVSGTLSSGTAGSWQSLSSTRTWVRNRTNDAAGTDTYVGTLEIRHAATQIVVASCTVTLSAQVLL